MIGKKTTTIDTIEYRCEKLNTQQGRIYNKQIKLVEDKICKRCTKDFWETLDIHLKSYYYDQNNTEVILPFNMDMLEGIRKCRKCSDVWNEYISMDDQRYRLDLKKMKGYKILDQKIQSEKLFDSYFE